MAEPDFDVEIDGNTLALIERKLSELEKRDNILGLQKRGRLSTGVQGLDGLIEGGVPERSLILLTGSCGTGKSTFAMNFLVDGAVKGEAGIYVSLEENTDESLRQMLSFGWPIEQLVRDKKLVIIQPRLYEFDKLVSQIENTVMKTQAKRLVIDSISLIGLHFNEAYNVRRALLELANSLKRLGCTTIAITEKKEKGADVSVFGVEEFVADGVIVMYMYDVLSALKCRVS